MKPTVAFIPARGGSKRIPRKNIAEIDGRPALSYPVEACLDSQLFDHVFVSSDDEEIRHVATDTGARALARPAILSDCKASIHDVLRYHLAEMEQRGELPELVCVVYATAVLLEARHLLESRQLLGENGADFVLAVRSFQPHPYKALMIQGDCLEPVFPDQFGKKSQEFPVYYAPAGVFHWMRTRIFLQGGDIWKQKRQPYVLEPHVAIDIDEPDDFELAKRLIRGRSR